MSEEESDFHEVLLLIEGDLMKLITEAKLSGRDADMYELIVILKHLEDVKKSLSR